MQLTTRSISKSRVAGDDLVLFLTNAIEFATREHSMSRKATHAAAKDLLEHRLMETIVVTPTRGAWVRRTRPVEQEATFGIDELHAWMQTQRRSNFFSEPRRLQHSHRFPVDVSRARQGVGLGMALDESDGKPGDAQ